jgi:hypothetical protein
VLAVTSEPEPDFIAGATPTGIADSIDGQAGDRDLVGMAPRRRTRLA